MISSAEQLAPPAVDARKLRAICAQFVTGVTVVTSEFEGDGVGVTVNSFTSVSLEPPVVLFCAHRHSRVRPAIATSGRFAVNILSSDQQHLSTRFASRASARIDAPELVRGVTGVPIIQESLGTIECRRRDEIVAGDHVIVLGDVEHLAEPQLHKSPLTFFRDSFASPALVGPIPTGVRHG